MAAVTMVHVVMPEEEKKMDSAIPIEKRPITLSFLMLLVTLGTTLGGFGYQLARVEENARRIQELEIRMTHTMTVDDAQEIKKRLEKIEDKVDGIRSRQGK